MTWNNNLTFEPICLSNLNDLYHFFKKELDKEAHFFFMPHTNIKPLALIIYLAMWIRHKINKANYILCYEKDNLNPIGFLLLIPEKNNSASLGLAVSQHRRKQGYGNAFMEEIIQMAKNNHLKMLSLTHEPSNNNAHNLYLKHGFTDKGFTELRSFFHKNRLETMMSLNL